MKSTNLILASVLFGSCLHAGVEKSFAGGYIVCVFDRPATITNQGSMLRVGLQNPSTHRWMPLPFSNDSSDPEWPREFVATDNPTDEIHNGGVLTVKKPVAIVFWNFKGGEMDVEFSVLPKRIRRLSRLPRFGG